MPSNLSTIGFAFASDDELMSTLSKLAGEAVERLACAPGDYAIWRSQTGAELWFHVSGERGILGRLEEGEVIGFTPFFEAREPTAVTLLACHKRQDENDFEGGFTARLDGGSMLDFVFDAIDFAAHDTRPLPLTTRIKLMGFAREVVTTDAAVDAPGVCAIGLTRAPANDNSADDGQGAEAPTAHAVIRGQVVEHATLENEETGATFRWLRVEAGPSLAIEILADPAVVKGVLAVGSHVAIGCAFFARILD